MHLTERQRKLLNLTFIDYHSTTEFLENPLVIDRAEGLYYWDTDGKRYFDAIGGIFVASLGHRHPRIMQAMRDQMEKITFAPPLHQHYKRGVGFCREAWRGGSRRAQVCQSL